MKILEKGRFDKEAEEDDFVLSAAIDRLTQGTKEVILASTEYVDCWWLLVNENGEKFAYIGTELTFEKWKKQRLQ